MKKNKYLAFILIFALILSCKTPKSSKTITTDTAKEVAMVSDQGSGMWHEVQLEKSKVLWVGKSPKGGHQGTLNLSAGKIFVENGMIAAGSFEIDMNSIYCKDLEEEPEDRKDLEDHLKSDDFFEVEKFPTASFELVKFSPKEGSNLININGNLTVKGITKNINFDATFDKVGESWTLKSNQFAINRIEWNIKYRSKSFFNDLKNRFIYDDIDIEIQLEFSK